MSGARTGLGRAARGLTLLELTIALMVTAMMGLAIASMMAMVGSVAQNDRDGRSTLLRAHTGQTRLGVYMNQAMCVLQHAPERNALVAWLHDKRGPGLVNLTEMRVFWHDPVTGTVSVERVEFPENWSEEMHAQADIALPAATDFVNAMQTQRSLGFTRTNVLLDRAWNAQWSLDAPQAQQARRARLTLRIGADESAAHPVLFAFGVANHVVPE